MPLLPIDAICLVEDTHFESECIIFRYIRVVELIKGVYRFMLPGHGQYITAQMNKATMQIILTQILSGCLAPSDSILTPERHKQLAEQLRILSYRFGTRRVISIATQCSA